MKKSVLTMALSTALASTLAHAEVNFNGFANIVAGQASSGDSQWGYDDDIDFKQDSLFALQASSDLGEGLSVTAQIIARGQDDWDAEFEWAYLAYNFNDDTRILAGRQRAPLYLFSDYLDVSYAYPWITPPEGVYDIELSTFDGVSLTHNFSLASFDATGQVFFGSDNDDVDVLGVTIDSTFDSIYGATFTLNRDWLTLRTAYLSTDLTIPDPTGDRLNAWRDIAGFEFIADQVNIDEDQAEFVEFAAQIDYNNWLFIAEYTNIDYDQQPIDSEESMYVTGGYRFDEVLVHLTYGRDENEVNSAINLLPVNNAELAELVNFTQVVFSAREQDSSYVTLGARWDFHESASFKIEFSRLDNDLINQDTSLIRTALVTVF